MTENQNDKKEILQSLKEITTDLVSNIDVYTQLASQTAVYPKDKELEYLTLGLVGEAGEVANKVKKVLRGDKELDKMALAGELGDVYWYLAMLSKALGIDASEILFLNALKLTKRKEEGTIKGDGDDR